MLGSSISLKILKQPKDVRSKPGMRVEFSFETSPAAQAYKWYFQSKLISSKETDYEGATTSTIIIQKCLPKHKGTYRCIVTNESAERFPSKSVTLTIGKMRFCFA